MNRRFRAGRGDGGEERSGVRRAARFSACVWPHLAHARGCNWGQHVEIGDSGWQHGHDGGVGAAVRGDAPSRSR